MKKTKKSSTIAALLLTSAIFLTACANQPSQTNVLNTENTESTTEEEMMMEMEMEIPPALTNEEAAIYQADLPIEERITLAKDLAMKMPKDGMNQMQIMFPDLENIEKIETEDSRNLMQMSPESWHYSAEADITIVVCDAANSPIHVFSGSNPSQEEIKEAADLMHEMMTGNHEENTLAEDAIEVAENEMENVEVEIPYTQEAPAYLSYSQELYDELLGKKPMALFFHADWCPTCLWMEENINNEISTFPQGTKIIEVNFDNELDLKSKYGIAVQSTVVVLDRNGNKVKTLAVPENRELISAIESSL